MDLELVKKLRQETGLSLAEIKKALEAVDGNLDKARNWLRENLNAKFDKTKDAKEGVIQGYTHHNGKIATLVHLTCNTDFAAKNEEFRQLAKDLSMHIASAKPQYLSVADIPPEILEAEKETLKNISRNSGKPEHLLDKIIQGRLQKFYSEVCLLEQDFVKKPKRKVKSLVDELAAKMQENITVKRFTLWQIGID